MSSDSETLVTDSGTEEISFQRYRLTRPDGTSQSFEQRLIYIGTAPDNDMVLDEPTASRVHARLEFDRSGYLIRDLKSKNGLTINGIRVNEAYVPPGAALGFGRADLSFELDDERVQVELATGQRCGQMLGQSSQMREIFALVRRVAVSGVTVLVEGESGTGKELVADAVHAYSRQRDKPLVVFDCSAVAPELIESELFGHVKGAFTGAHVTRIGVFEEANGGTLFLDEVGELPLDLQPKLLRALEKGEFRPVGTNDRRTSDVRVIAATNRQLDKEVDAGNFRQDLYYRLAVIKIRLPALRQRPEDIPLLVKHFLAATDASDVQVSFETMERLKVHRWPGNVRELKNYVARAVVLAEDGRLETRHLSGIASVEAVREVPSDGPMAMLGIDLELPFKDAKARLLDAFERRYWQRLLDESGGNISEAARQGGIHRKSLEYLMKKLDMRSP